LAYSYVSLALTGTRIPLIYRMGDCPPTESGFQSWLWRKLAGRSNRIVAISNFVASRAQEARIVKGAISVIYNLAPTRALGERTRTGANPSHAMNRIVYVGAIAEHKGLLPLIDAFACLASEDATLRLDLAGGSRYDTQFREQLKSTLRDRGLLERACFHGHVSDPASLYERAAVHVAPSICEEAAGNVVLEAKTVGTPSVVFPSGGLPEMIRHGIDGYVCRERSVDALVEGIRWCLADPTRWGGLSAQARRDSEARFGPARFASAWAAVYKP
jgi:glycosyltransferase involved in cell wall biosynthesis